jgi:hypothetical protein
MYYIYIIINKLKGIKILNIQTLLGIQLSFGVRIVSNIIAYQSSPVEALNRV